MAISLDGLGGPLSPDERIRQLLEDYALAREVQLQRLLDAGIAKERISIVTRRECATCSGMGWASQEYTAEGSYTIAISDCPDCPGLCVDGASVREAGEAIFARVLDAAEAEGHRVHRPNRF